jgi:hypothetical protein
MGSGDDSVSLSSGSNTIDGGTGDDTLNMNDGEGSIVAGSGDDVVTVSSGAFTVLGGLGDDSITGNGGSYSIGGGQGDDTVDINGDGLYAISGALGNDSIEVSSGAGTINGGGGNDTISANSGVFTISGGTGDDSITLTTLAGSIAGGSGHDTINVSFGSYVIHGGLQGDQIFAGIGADAANGVENATVGGGQGFDFIEVNGINTGLDVSGTVQATGGLGGDTFQLDLEYNGADVTQDAANLTITDLTASDDTLIFHGSGTAFTSSTNLDASFADNAAGDVTIQINTTGANGDGTVTVVLEGVGTGISSFTDLDNAGYHIQFT